MRKTARIKSQSSFYSAFSLIELLAVISVTTLLIGLALPALSRTRAIAKQAVCQSRLRQWGLAFEIYAHRAIQQQMQNWRIITPAGLTCFRRLWVKNHGMIMITGRNPVKTPFFNALPPGLHRTKVTNTDREEAATFHTL